MCYHLRAVQCPRCQHEAPPRAKFCPECATPLPAHCAKCEGELPVAAKFCPQCAAPVGVSPDAAPRFASPVSYTPTHLAERIRTSKDAVEGERKHVTVLFADLKGSMELLADRDPEDARRALKLGAPPEIGHCHRALAQLSPSSEHAASARRIFDELGMAFWRSRV
jgi:Double zinc ribbon